MKINELRTGNWVTLNGFPMYIDAIYSDMVSLTFKENEGDSWEEYCKDLTPIPLSKELLMKLGFEENSILNEEPVYSLYGKEEDIYILYKDGVYFHAYEYDSYVTKTIQCTGLHSLQNKYFALNGEELEVNL